MGCLQVNRLKWGWFTEQSFLHVSQAEKRLSVPEAVLPMGKQIQGVQSPWPVVAFGQGQIPSSGKVWDPRAWSETPTLQASSNHPVIKHYFISPPFPVLPSLMKLHLN